jgi:DNA repair protein RadC
MTNPQSMTIHDLPSQDRPRERLFTQGATALSEIELLAILIGTGSKSENALMLAQRLLKISGGLYALARTSPDEIAQIHGIGRAKAAKIVASLELGFRLTTSALAERPQINTAKDAVQLMRDMGALTQEHVRVMLLDSSQRLITTKTLYIGTVNTAVIRVAEVLREAVIRNSPSIVLIHNHPSGDKKPSPEDIDLTRALVSAGKLMDIQLTDHIIIAGHEWTSLREMRLGFEMI